MVVRGMWIGTRHGQGEKGLKHTLLSDVSQEEEQVKYLPMRVRLH